MDTSVHPQPDPDMYINLDPQSFPQAHVDVQPLIEAIAGGNAILFVGSGFSRNAIGLDGKPLLTASELARKIGELGKFEADEDLRYASEKYIRDNNPVILVEMLLDLFSIKDVLPHQKSIASAPWRRIYTTNYDMCIEEAGKIMGKKIHSASLTDKPGDFLARKNSCVHLNGSIQTLTTDSLNNSFKLSESSYLSSDSFVNSDWYYPFKRDLEMCSILVFVGYSLYDIEIQKMLFSNEEFKRKTYFFTSPSITERERFKLAPFGECISIGAEGFAKYLDNMLSISMPKFDELPLTSVIKYIADDNIKLARDNDVERFLMYGDVKNEILDSASYTDDGAPLLIRRRDVVYATEVLNSGKHIAIVSDFGNGKTIFLRTLKSNLSRKGVPVYSVENEDIYNREDLEILAKSLTRTYIFIDSYDHHLDFLQHFSDLSSENLVLILAARTGNHDRARPKLNRIGISFDEIAIDELDEEEINRFVAIIDNVGFWGAQATFSPEKKFSFVQQKNKSQLQQSLLSILQAPQIISRISLLLKELFVKKTWKDTIFSISLLSALDHPLHQGLISEIAGNNDIYDSNLRGNESFKSLFKIENGRVSSRSSLFSLILIRHSFEAVFIVDKLLDIQARLKNHTASEHQTHELIKSLLRFSNVERLFPENQRINNLVRYYEKVKMSLAWLKNDPHYWLQYGMALIAYDSLDKAQRMLDLSYEFASKRQNYHTVHIDMQQSRLLLKTSAAEEKSSESYKIFKKAIDFFGKVPDDFQKFLLADEILHVFNLRFVDFSTSNKNSFISTVEKLIKDLNNFINANQELESRVRRLESARVNLEKIISEGKK